MLSLFRKIFDEHHLKFILEVLQNFLSTGIELECFCCPWQYYKIKIFELFSFLEYPYLLLFLFQYCLTACLYAKCCNLIGWTMERGPSIHFRIDGPDRLYGFRSKLKHRILGKMVEKLSTEVVKSLLRSENCRKFSGKN